MISSVRLIDLSVCEKTLAEPGNLVENGNAITTAVLGAR